MAWCFTTAFTWPTKPVWRNCLALTFTASTKPLVVSCCSHLLIWAQAVSRTHCPMGRISPDSSARGINCAGEIKPCIGCIQRINTSAPIGRWVPSAWIPSTCSWKYNWNCCFSSALRSSRSRVAWVLMDSCIFGSKKCSVLRPAFLDWYMAMSACFISSSIDCELSLNSVAPMLGVLWYTWEASWYAWLSVESILLPTNSVCSAASKESLLKSTSIITNSSPPNRATVSPSRTHDSSRFATCWSSKSPMSCPSVSFSVLKLSRSMNRSAPVRPLLSIDANDCLSLSNRSRRLGRRVRGS